MAQFFGIDLTIAGIVVLLAKAFLAFVLIVLSDFVIAHQFEWKHTLIMALLALFATPIVTTLMYQSLNITIPFFDLLVSLAIWVVAGEILLPEGDWQTKLKVALLAFVGFTLISTFGDAYITDFVTTRVVS